MTILAVDNYPDRLAGLKKELEIAFPNDKVITFIDPMLAVKYSVSNEVNTLLTITEMKRMDGFMLAEGIRRWWENVRVYYILENDEEPDDSNAKGYIHRPVTKDSLVDIANSFW